MTISAVDGRKLFRWGIGIFLFYCFLCQLIYFRSILFRPLLSADGASGNTSIAALVCISGLIASLCLFMNMRTRLMHLLLCLLWPVDLYINPSMNMVSSPILSVVLILIWFLNENEEDARSNVFVIRLTLVYLGVIYMISGLSKALNPHWRDGTAIIAVMNSVVGRYRLIRLEEHLLLSRCLTWATFLIEAISGACLTLQFRVRPTVAVLIGFHLALCFFLKLAELQAPLLIILVSLLFLSAKNAEPHAKFN